MIPGVLTSLFFVHKLSSLEAVGMPVTQGQWAGDEAGRSYSLHSFLHINVPSAWGRSTNLLDFHFEIYNEEKLVIPERMLGVDPTKAVLRCTRT